VAKRYSLFVLSKEYRRMKKRLFVEQPNLDLKAGIQVLKDTELTFKNENVEQVLKDLKLETIKDEKGTNGINAYESKAYISIHLNEGDILLFDETIGYYMPRFPVTTITDAISDIESLRDFEKLEVEEDVQN
jgi:hypothetical protein